MGMSSLIRWNPYDEIQRMRDDFQRLFATGFPWLGRESAEWGPSIDLRETEQGFIVEAELPGVNPDDVDVTVSEDVITLRGEVREQRESGETGFRQIERRYGSFHRSISFPSPVEHERAVAEYRDGILRISVPKAHPSKAKATKVRIGGLRSEGGELQ